MQYPETIELQLKKKHFINSSYTLPAGCPVAKALTELYPYVAIGPDEADVLDIAHSEIETGEQYVASKLAQYHMCYWPEHYYPDTNEAQETQDLEEVIRTLTLTKTYERSTD